MGRQENPLEPGAGPVQRFASELRGLRQRNGALTYRAMARRTRFTASTLSRAAAGEHLPSLAVTLAYVEACGGDREEWERRWREASDEVAAADLARDDDGPAPYRGLARFEPDDHDRFFGRDELVAELLALVRAHRFTAVVGASGSGKSSLLRAGLIPALRDPDSSDQPPATIRILAPGEHPLRTHRERLAPVADAAGDTVVVVDQFEEVFTLCRDPAERAGFIDLLLTAREPGSRLRVIVAVRADFYGRLADHAPLAAAVNASSLLVGPMSPAELRQAIVKPAQAAGLLVERALTARIMDDIGGEPGGLPLMSHALLETWRRRRGRTLTLEAYEAAGGVHSAVAHTAERVHTQLPPDHAALARRILLRLITPGEDAQDTRRPADRTELDGTEPTDVETVLDRLAAARLITLDGSTVDLAHEALITTWPRLRGWVDAERHRLRLHRRLTEDARAWEELDRDPGVLYRGARLSDAEDAFPTGRRAELTVPERAFLTASLDARDQERRAAARATRRLRTLAGALSLLLLVAVATSVVAVRQQRTAVDAERQAVQARETAESRQLAAQSTALRGSDPELAALLAVQAYRTRPTPEAVNSLYGAADLTPRHRLAGHLNTVEALAFSPDGATLATYEQNRLMVWDVAAGTLRHDHWIHRASRTAVAFSADGSQVATAIADGRVAVWDAATGRAVRTANLAVGGRDAHVAFSPDGTVIATGGNRDGVVRLWDAASGTLVRTLGGGATAPVRSLAFSPDGTSLAAGGGDGGVRLWEVASGEVIRAFDEVAGGSEVWALAFSPDGGSVAVGGSEDGTVGLWDVASGRSVQVLNGHSGRVNSVAFSADGASVATASDEDGTGRLWDVATGGARRTFTGMGISAVAFSPDGATLATGSSNVPGHHSAVRLWDLAAGQARHTLSGVGWDPAVAVSPDGTALAVASREGTAVFDLASGDLRRRLTDDWTSSVAFSPDGTTVATGGRNDGTVRMWSAATGELSRTVPVGLATMSGLTFAPGGALLARSGWEEAALVDPAGGDVLQRFTADEHGEILDFSPDGSVLVCVRGGELRLWDTATGEESGVTLDGSRGQWIGGPVAISPDEGTLVGDPQDGQAAVLWDMTTGEARGGGIRLGTGITAMVFSPDGATLAIGTYDGAVTFVDIATGKTRASFSGHTSYVGSLAFSPDGEHLVTAGNDDGSVRVWDIALPTAEEAADQICRAVRRDLTRDERAEYLTDASAEPACPGHAGSAP